MAYGRIRPTTEATSVVFSHSDPFILDLSKRYLLPLVANRYHYHWSRGLDSRAFIDIPHGPNQHQRGVPYPFERWKGSYGEEFELGTVDRLAASWTTLRRSPLGVQCKRVIQSLLRIWSWSLALVWIAGCWGLRTRGGL